MKTPFVYMLFVITLLASACAANNSAAPAMAQIAPTSTVVNTGIASSSGWNAYVTNLTYAPSNERGWKNIVLDVVFESTNPSPYPLFYAKYVSVLDSTNTWRERVRLCCSAPNRMSTEEEIVLPTGIRFSARSEPIRVPENATLEQFKIEVCGTYECNPVFAVWETTVTQTTPPEAIVFPYTDLPPNIATLGEADVTIELPNVARLTYFSNYSIGEGAGGSTELSFELEVENLTGNDLSSRNIFSDVYVTSVTDAGTIRVNDNIVCYLNGDNAWRVPPGYVDRLFCTVTVQYSSAPPFNRVWIGFSRNRGYFLQVDAGNPNWIEPTPTNEINALATQLAATQIAQGGG